MKISDNTSSMYHSIIALSIALIGFIVMLVFFFINYYLHLVVPMFIGILGIVVSTFIATNDKIEKTEKRISIIAFGISSLVTILSLVYFFNTVRVFIIYTNNIGIA